MQISKSNLVNGCDLSNSRAGEARHVSKVEAILSPTTTKGTTVGREALRSYCKSEKRPHSSKR